MSPGQNLVLARQMLGWVRDRDIDSFGAVLDEDVLAFPAVGGGPALAGRRAVLEWWNGYAGADNEVEIRPLDYEPNGNCVIVRGYLRERSERGLSESQHFWLYEFAGGKVVRMESHSSRTLALASCA